MATSLHRIALPRRPTPIIKQCVALYHTTKVIAHRKWQHPLGTGYRQYLHSVGRPLKPPSVTNCLVAIVHTKPVNSNISPKIGCHGSVPQHRWTPSNTWFLGPIRVLNQNGISIGSAVFAQGTTECPYTLQWGAPFPLRNYPFLWEDLDPHLIRGSLGQPT